jgi:spore coat polysaccharide biosynthesis protein SpsF
MNIIIQARMNSKRLPGKVLLKVKDITILDYIIYRLSFSKYKNIIIIATSTKKSDDPIHNYCIKNNIKCFRGDLNNVTERYMELIKHYKFNSFLRICADSPMIDHRIVDKAITLYNSDNYDLITNKFPRSFPIGQTVEILRSKKFLKSIYLIKSNAEKENVTEHYYNNHKYFNIKNFKDKENHSLISLAIDTKKNFLDFKKFLVNSKYNMNNIPYKSIIKIYGSKFSKIVNE